MTLRSIAQAARARLAALGRGTVANIPDALLVAGAASLTYGAWLIYLPAGYIVAGVLLLAAGFLCWKVAG